MARRTKVWGMRLKTLRGMARGTRVWLEGPRYGSSDHAGYGSRHCRVWFEVWEYGSSTIERGQDAGNGCILLHLLLDLEPDLLPHVLTGTVTSSDGHWRCTQWGTECVVFIPHVLSGLPANRLHQRVLQLHGHHGVSQLLRQSCHLQHQIRTGNNTTLHTSLTYS